MVQFSSALSAVASCPSSCLRCVPDRLVVREGAKRPRWEADTIGRWEGSSASRSAILVISSRWASACSRPTMAAAPISHTCGVLGF
eukprot:1195424-Prorocentrum_minimum.AAC.13